MAESPGPATTGRSLVQQSTEQDANSSYPSPSHPLPLKRKKKEPGAPTLKNVVVLRSSDVRKWEGKLLMPYTTEMSAIKKSPNPRFKKLEISSSMTQYDIQAKLEEIFPYLQQQRFHFAKAVEGGSRLELYGEPSIWDGHLIKQRLTGNSVLYILTDEENDDEQDPTVSNLSTNTCLLHNPMATTGSSRESDQVPRRVDSGDLSGHGSSVVNPIQCSSSYGTVTEVVPSCSSSCQQSPVNVVVNVAGTRACMNNATEGDQVNEETLESQNESQLSDWPSDSGIEGTDNPFVDERGNGDSNSLDLGVTIYPQAVPLQGGQVCWFDFTPMLPLWFNSGTANFGLLGTVELSRHNNSLIGRPIPARPEAGSENVILRSETGVYLGQTEIEYYDEVERSIEFLVRDSKNHPRLLRALASASESSAGDGQISASCGSTQPLKTLKLSVYAAAKFGAKRFLKTVFSSKAGRKVFNAYKDNPPLPEVIARKYGHEETASYLEEITIRFSREANIFPKEPQEIDWQELIALSEETKENQELCISCDDENHRAEYDVIIDTGYLGDTETSSSTMSSPSRSDSEIDDTGFCFKEHQKPTSSTNKDQDNENESTDTTAADHRHSDPLFRSERETWQKVHTKAQHTRPPRGGPHRGRRIANATRGAASRSVRHQNQHDDGRQPIRGRGTRGRRGRGISTNTPGRGHGRGGPNSQPGAEQRQRYDPVFLGFTQPDIKYESNKLYVLGLRHKSSRDSLKNFMELVSGGAYKVRHLEWFGNGKAIVTLNTKKLSGPDFSNMLTEAKRRPQEGVNYVIEGAPECKSIFVSEFSEDTTVEQVEAHFDKEVGSLDLARGVQVNHRLWEEDKKHKRAIVYLKDKESVKKATTMDHFLNEKALHVEAFYPYMGITGEDKQPKGSLRPLSGDPEGSRQPEFYKSVNRDLMEFIMKSNQEVKLREELDVKERARIRWNEDGYVLIKYGGHKVDQEFDEQVWKRHCSDIVDAFLDNCCAKDFPLEEEILDEVADQLPQVERALPKLTAQVKLQKESCQLILICQKSNMPDFEERLKVRLKDIKREVLERKLEQKRKTDIPCEKLQLLQNARIEDILKKEINTEVQAKLDLGSKSLVVKTPKDLMASVMSYLKQRLDEIDHNSMPYPPEILDILKTNVGKRKMAAELPEGCSFNVDEKTKKVILLGRTPEGTIQGRTKAMEVLISDRSLVVNDKDNHLIGSEKWKDLCKKLEKRLKIRTKRELSCIAVFGFRQDVSEAVTKMRDFVNEKKATEGEFRLGSSIHRRFFNEFYKDELSKIKEKLAIALHAVEISLDENGDRIVFSGTGDGVKQVEERLYLLQEQIKEKMFNISTPGMRSFLAQEDGKRLIAAVEQEQKCIIEITEQNGDQHEVDESEDDEPLSTSSDGEDELDENKETIVTSAGKKVIWKTGNIEEEKADILVCSVGSNFKLSIGAVATAMSKAAGPALQQALREKEDETADLGEGDIIHTVAGDLPCRWVIHFVCCPWKETAEQKQILRDLLRKCFDKASLLGASTIGLPLIGTGNLGFPYDVAVQIMIEAALDYSQANPDSPLEEFRFIVYSRDQLGITEFEEKFKKFKKENYSKPRPSRRPADLRKRRQMTPVSEFSCKEVYLEGLTVKLVKGDITQEFSDAICNVVTQDLDMESGNLSKVIAEVCGEAVQRELRSKAPQRPGEVLMTSAGLLSTKNIIHMVVVSGNKKHLQTCVEKALKVADSEGLDSVSIPAVGSGGLGLSPEDSAEVVFKAIATFADKPSQSVYDVRVVVFDDSKIGAFVNEMEDFQRENAPISCSEANEEVADAAYNDETLEAPADDLPTYWRRQKVIVHGSTESFDAVIEALKDGLVKACKDPRVIKHDVINRLSKRCIRDLKRMARARDVKLDQPEADTIRLEGLPKDVMDINLGVSDAIEEQREREHREERAEQTSKTVQWYMVDVSGKLEPFEKMANNEIDSAYKSKKPSLFFTHEDLKAEINFGTMEVTFLRNGRIKQVQRIDVYPLPDEWDPQPRDERGKEEILHLVSLAQDSQEFKTVEEKFLQSLRGKVSITNIERVQNPSLFNAYIVRKQTLDLKNGPHENQLELFHGTKYESFKPINVQGFNRSLCGKNATAYGDGVHFAKDASYSETYSQPGPHGERCMYLARVLVGKYIAGKQGMKSPPPIDPTKPEILYDSFVNRKDDPTIFVIFNDSHCYPEYIITFKRL